MTSDIKHSRGDMTLCVVHPQIDTAGYASLSVATNRASTIVFDDAEAYRTRKSRGPKGYSYGLSGTPTSRTLERQLALLEGGGEVVLAPSGLSAITLVMMAVLRPGDHILVSDAVYPPVRKFCREYLGAMGITYGSFRADGLDLAEQMTPRTRLVWAESPGSTTMEVTDLAEMAALAHRHGALIGCDNTWATGLYLKPLDLGIDFSMQALTKYAGGHSDLLMGAVAVRDPQLHQQLLETRGVLGLGVSPDDCALVLRGLETMAVRLQHMGTESLRIARHLSERPSVQQVLHPALPQALGHDIWRRDFSGASGTFSVELHEQAGRVIDTALDQAHTFCIGASWGGTRSLIVPMQVDGDRDYPLKRPGAIYVRMSIGLEQPEDLWNDLDLIFGILDAEATHRVPA